MATCIRCGFKFHKKRGLKRHFVRKTPCEADVLDISCERYLSLLKSHKFLYDTNIVNKMVDNIKKYQQG